MGRLHCVTRSCNLADLVQRGLRAMLTGLLGCPLCHRRPAGEVGVCDLCRATSLAPGRTATTVWLGLHGSPLGAAVRCLKYRGATRLAGWLGEALAAEVRRSNWSPERVCPVPLHVAKLRRRGYNQARLLAQVIAADLGAPLIETLERTHDTSAQAGRGRIARITNVAGAFRCQPLPPCRVLLVDDVLTTGATAQACAVALRRAGATQVRLAVVTRAGPAGLRPEAAMGSGLTEALATRTGAPATAVTKRPAGRS